MFTDTNIYSINNKTDYISENYISYRKKSLTKVDIFGGSDLEQDTDPDPYQNETDPQHCILKQYFFWHFI